jgi:LacI family transcriptional regulator
MRSPESPHSSQRPIALNSKRAFLLPNGSSAVSDGVDAKTPVRDFQMNPNSQATLKRIANLANVSMTTVSRVLSGQATRYRISKDTQAAVQKLAREFNFVPNRLARSLRLKKTQTIGLIIPDISNPFFASIARQIALGTRKHGYSIILCDSQETEDLEINSLELLRAQHVEGIILCPVGLSAEHLSEFKSRGTAIVVVDRIFPDVDLPYVGSDNLAGARTATEFLLQNGHRRIACLQGLRKTFPNELRVRGYREAFAHRHLAIDENLIVGDSFGEQSGYIETKLLLKAHRDITAILALSNQIALGSIRALAEEKLRIPEDVSIIGFDDQPYSAYLATPLTAVAQQPAEMGEVVVKLLFDQINFPSKPARGGILLPTTLVARDSVKRIG